MERGEDWEYVAVQDQWATIERQRRVTKRLVAALLLGLLAFALFMFAVTKEACVYGWGAPNTCTPVTTGAVFDVLVIAGIGALGGGLWLCLSVRNTHTDDGRNGC